MGATFTIPGPVLTTAESKGLWAWFCLHAVKAGWSFIWRLEVQERGALHWHAVAITPEVIEAFDQKLTPAHEHYRFQAGYTLTQLWFRALDSLGPRTFNPPYFGKEGEWKSGIVSVPGLSSMPGARHHSAKVDGAGTEGAWLRYLQDHTSKAKQQQIPEGMGRHWGIVGRARFVRRIADTIELDEREWFRVMRMLQRLATPSIKREGVPFGRALGKRNRRGGFGRSIWFSKPETVSRLVQWSIMEGKAK